MKMLPPKMRPLWSGIGTVTAVAALVIAFSMGATGSHAQETSTTPAAEFDPAAAQALFQQKVEAAKPHIERLKVFVGEWEVHQKLYFGGPGAPPIEQVAQESVTMLGEFWLISHVKSEMMGEPFEGRASIGYDVMKEKYVMYWVDTMAPYGMFFEGTYDEATKTFTYECAMKDAWTGLDTVYTITDREHEDGTIAWEMKQKSAMGEMKMMEATYKRKEG